jgi:hypothetical protein
MNKFYIDPDCTNDNQRKLKISILANDTSIPELLFLTIGFVVFSALFTFVFWENFEDIHLWFAGQSIDAVVQDCDEGTGFRGGRTVEVSYTYSVLDTTDVIHSYAQEERVGPYVDCKNIGDGQLIEVKYNASYPDISRVVDARLMNPIWIDLLSNLLIWLILAIVVLMDLLTFVGVVVYIRASFKWLYLRGKGILLDGEIVEIDFREEIRGGYYIKIIYNFLSPDSQILGQIIEKRRDDLKYKPLPQPGTPVTILYADDDCHIML